MAMGEDEPAERRAAEAEGERPPKVARMAPPAVLDIVSTLSVCTSDSGITDDGALAQSEVHVTRREPARSERGAPPGGSCTALVVSLTANLNAGASSPSQSALDTASGCGSAPASPVVRLDAPAATDNAHLPPAVPACDQPPSNGSDADQGAACNTGGDSSDAGATPAMDDAGSGAGRSVNSIPQRERATVGGSGAGRSAESVPCLPMALQEYEVFTFFETTVGVAESELPRARKSISLLLQSYSAQCDMIEPEESFKAPHRRAVQEMTDTQGDVMIALLYTGATDPPVLLGLLGMQSRRRDDLQSSRRSGWTVALIHTPDQQRRQGFASRLWARMDRELPPGSRVSVEAPQCLAGAARRFWTHPDRGFRGPKGADEASFSSMYDVLDTFGRPPPAPRISLSYEKPAPPSVGRAGKRRLL